MANPQCENGYVKVLLPTGLNKKLTNVAFRLGRPKSEIARRAIEFFFRKRELFKSFRGVVQLKKPCNTTECCKAISRNL